MSAEVRFEGVKKSYDGRTLVVEILDLAVASGEFLTLLGPGLGQDHGAHDARGLRGARRRERSSSTDGP